MTRKDRLRLPPMAMGALLVLFAGSVWAEPPVADEISLVGTPDRIRDRLHAFEESPVTMLNVAPRSSDHLRQVAELILA